MRIDALNKPVGIWCEHAVTKKGCAIYTQRPAECQAFYCAWLINAELGEEWRPTKSKIVLFYEGGGNRIAAHVDGGWPGAWRNEPYYSQLKHWAWSAIEHRGQVCVYVKDEVIVILPTKDVDLRRFEPGDHIITAQRSDGWDA